MTEALIRKATIGFLASIAVASCASAQEPATQQPATQPPVTQSPGAAPAPGLSPAQQAQADRGVPPFTAADVEFMQGMIGHHAQAIHMSRLAPTHGASPQIQILAERIDVSQKDEIDFMQRWLKQRGAEVPAAEPHAGHAGMTMKLMSGMLTPEQMSQLEAARGREFDRLFLTFMIQHHVGALTMVEKLFASHGAAQDDDVFKFASDVSADQDSEIRRMRSMLEAMGSSQ